MKQIKKRIVGLVAIGVCLGGISSAVAQQGNSVLQSSKDAFFAGEWEGAITSLTELLLEGNLGKQEESQARKFIGLSHILLGNEGKAIVVYKDLVRNDPDFTMQDLSIEGNEPPGDAIRILGEAVLTVRQEEIRLRDAQLSQTSRKVAFMRSLALPGWGQRYQGYRGRSYMLLGLTAGSIGYAVWTEMGFRDARDAYNSAPRGTGDVEFDKLYTDYKDKGDLADLALALVGGFWALNAIDAAIQGPNITRQMMAIQPAPAGDGVQLVYTKRF
jgi:hypothetical protein